MVEGFLRACSVKWFFYIRVRKSLETIYYLRGKIKFYVEKKQQYELVVLICLEDTIKWMKRTFQKQSREYRQKYAWML